MKNRPLAHLARPTKFDDVVGQAHLVGKDGVIRKMIEQDHFSSLILYGPPGTGKTTIASIIGEAFGLNHFTFNASTDNKAQLREIIEQARHYKACLIVDEIHRMKKDIQDYLLPYVEKGDIIMIGLTTNNPYHSVNPAIRSRVHIYKLNPVKTEEIVAFLKRLEAKFSEDLTATLDESVYAYIIQSANHEIRSSINRLELIHELNPHEKVSLENAKKLLLRPALSLDKDEDNYFNILSAFQKSIRGSHVHASLHYLARLIAMEDLDSILRRLTVIAYEDIGLANPSVLTKMDACANACLRVGFPEARIILSTMVIDLALSPKSNSSVVAIDKALADIEAGKTPKIPNHLINIDNFETKESYKYPHSYENHIINQAYMPDELKHTRYYEPSETGKYERALKAQLEWVAKILDKKE
ncbi:MAG: replication-associated recombination protein A [Candidatus Izemoplasmataceae bacterium]